MRALERIAAVAVWLHKCVAGHRARSEQGQAVILVAAAAVALIGMLVLVVDTSHLYSQQRLMRTAADAAAMAGAQNWLTDSAQLNVAQAVADSRQYASLNGYTTSTAAGNGVWDPSSTDGVKVSIPPSSGPYSGSTQYVEVVVTKPVTTFFGGIFNISTVQTTARAVARGMAASLEASIIALGTSPNAIASSGSSTTNVVGNIYSAGGVACNSGNIVLYQGSAYAVGGYDTACQNGQLQVGSGYGVYSGVPPLYDPRWPSFESLAPAGPGGNWSSLGKTPGPDGYVHVPAGTYNSILVSAGDNVAFDGGVYHLLGDGNNPALEVRGTVATAAPLQFVLESGAIHFESRALGTLSSGAEFNNILIYSKRIDGGNAIQVSGGASLAYNGTIYAPQANVSIAGNSSAIINGQLVAKTITFGGSSGTAITWDESKAPVIVQATLVE